MTRFLLSSGAVGVDEYVAPSAMWSALGGAVPPRPVSRSAASRQPTIASPWREQEVDGIGH